MGRKTVAKRLFACVELFEYMQIQNMVPSALATQGEPLLFFKGQGSGNLLAPSFLHRTSHFNT